MTLKEYPMYGGVFTHLNPTSRVLIKNTFMIQVKDLHSEFLVTEQGSDFRFFGIIDTKS